MSFTNDEKTNLLLKKFFGKPSSVNEKAQYLEPSIDARGRIFGQEHIYSQNVPTARPGDLVSPTLDDSGNAIEGSQAGFTSTSNSVVRKQVKIELEEVPGAGGRAYRASNDGTQGRVFKDIIPFNRDTGGTFAQELQQNDGTTVIPPGTTGGDYVVDTDAGVLTFQEYENVSNVVTAVAPPKITFYRYVGGVGIDDAIARYIDASGITSGGGGSGIDTSGANAGDVLVVDGSGNITFVTPGEADVILTGDVEQVVTANKIFNIGPVHVTNGLTVSGKITAGGGFQLPSGANQDQVLVSDANGNASWQNIGNVSGAGTEIDTSGASAGDVLVVDSSGGITWATPGVANVVFTGDVEQIVTANKIFNFGPVHNNNSVTVSGSLEVDGNITMRTGAQSGYILTSDSTGRGHWQPLLSGDVGEAFLVTTISNGLYVSGPIPDVMIKTLSLSGGADFSGGPVDYVLSLQGDNKPAAWRRIQEASGFVTICGMSSADSITVTGDVNVIGGSVVSYASASDQRIKEDIHPLDDTDYETTIERFMATPMYSYRQKSGYAERGGFDPRRKQRGFLAQEFERSYPGSTNLLPISEHGGTGNRGRLSDRRGLRDGGEEEGKDDEGDGDGMDISGIMVLNMEKEFSSREVPVMLRYLLNQNTILSEKVRVLSSYIEKIGKGGGEDRQDDLDDRPVVQDGVPTRSGQLL